jgi:NADH-quinone oxidoreductase subunit J
MAETWQEIVFWVLAVVMTGAALRVVTAANVVHAALYLVGALMGAAVLYVLLLAEFVAWVQVLVYVGAIVVLMLFGLMLTRAPIGRSNLDNNQRLLAALVAGAVFISTSAVLIDGFKDEKVNLDVTRGIGTDAVGDLIFRAFVLPFEVISVLLLAALVGAIVMARRDDAG